MEDEKENEIYDRQIRLWGLEAQKRMRSSKVFFAGINALSLEVCKNLVLAGVSVTLQDSRTVTAEDTASHFLFSEQDIGKTRAAAAAAGLRELNGLVAVAVAAEGPAAAVAAEGPGAEGAVALQGHQVVCVAGAPRREQLRVNALCRRLGAKFYAGAAAGFDGWLFADLGDAHEYREEVPPGAAAPGAVRALAHCPLADALAGPWGALADRFGPPPKALVAALVLQEFEEVHGELQDNVSDTQLDELKSFVQQKLQENGMATDFFTEEELRGLARAAAVELAPTAAVLGGVWGQEVLKAISAKGEPMDNTFVLTGLEGEGKVLRLPGKKR